MKKISLICLFILGVFAMMILPLGIFEMQDYMHLRTYKGTESNTYEMFSTYPIISQLYAATYEQDSTFHEPYNLTDLTPYKETELEQLTQSKKAFEQQLNALVDHELLTPSKLMSETKQIQLDNGYMTHLLNDTSLTMNLHQIYSIDQELVKSQRFTYLKQADKIIQFEVTNDRIVALDEEERKQLAWAMINYLGLSEIDDWTYLDHGYESYQAKLQVYCRIYTPPSGYLEYQIGVLPLGQSNEPSILPTETVTNHLY